ncbi:MAG TPA: M23 family metallopeptidase [Candidatus Sulfotelmatobacter sp.]|jgi:murein DD-endopeptidase MepM/ murein hydrolase activator NlpD|nr:M23 family metallopeptidase [Candidatus Sulfotelmatobacter sp.]
MHRRSSHKFALWITFVSSEAKTFFEFLFYYGKKKLINFSVRFEKNKNRLVKFFLMKRGRYNRPFLHLTTMGVLGVGVLIAPFLANTYPIFASQNTPPALASTSATKQSALIGEQVFQTNVSAKPRDSIIDYQVERGDTLATIAKKFDISEDTVRWVNNLKNDDLSVGDTLQILPVTGIAYKVQSGDTIYTIAKKYNTDAQKIADFPFNEFAGDGTSFALVTGEVLIVPDGIEPSAQQTVKPQVYIAQGPVAVATGGWYFPVQGEITQYPIWYHMALDIAGPIGSPVYAAHSGTIDRVSVGTFDTGYGNNVWIDDGDGIKTHYAHLNSVAVSVGQRVLGGQTIIGYRGNTGRSTGPHTHFEVQVNGALINPLTYVSP